MRNWLIKNQNKLKLLEIYRKLDKRTACVFIQHANNGTGVITNFEDLSNIIKEAKGSCNFIFHCDCVQGLGKTKIDMNIQK